MVSGSDGEEAILRAARIVADNPSISIPLHPRRDRDARSFAEREVWRLAEQVGFQQKFTLSEVVAVVAKAYKGDAVRQEILVSPRDVELRAPLGAGFNYLGDYIDAILRAARRVHQRAETCGRAYEKCRPAVEPRC